MQARLKLFAFTKFTWKKYPEEHIAEFHSQMSFHQPDNRVYCRAFPSNLTGPALKSFNRLPEGCIRTYVSQVRQDKDDHCLMTLKQRGTESIASFQEQFRTEFHLKHGANHKIAMLPLWRTCG
ncbi:hypothetical protein LIER_22917 [Lithospermum erythrorhizon]|uniref:Retrotransposon gag domain-containing protein n=1 Tax=Lithospermum erythrorhizon TaxID=34254 RepID=A0AAV3QXU7_LITER